MRTICASVLIPALLVATSALAAPPAPTPITSCGQTVPTRGRAVLAADLDCTGEPLGVILFRGARLALGGFTLSGADVGVQCSGGCTVTGPGTISNNRIGVVGLAAVVVRDVVLSGFTVMGVDAETALRVSGSTVTGAALYALSGHTVKVENSSISSSFGGVSADHARVRGSTITGCTRGFAGSSASLLEGSTVDTSAAGPDARTFRTWKRPRVDGSSSCVGRSERIKTGEPWGVCSQD